MQSRRNMARVLHLAVLLVGVGACAACGPSRPYVWVKNFPADDGARRIQAGDTLAVAVKDQSDLSGSFTVRENGAYAQPVVGQIRVAGLTEAEASKRLAGLLDGIVVDPKVAVTVVTPRPVRVAVLGEVTTGGQYTVEYNESILSVLARAGGLSPFADRDGIYVIRKRPELVRIRFRYDDLKGGDPAATRFRLHDGDVIVVE